MADTNEPDPRHEDGGHGHDPGNPASPGHRRRRRRKRKVRKRIRIKKKSGPLRKVRKVLEKVLWVVIIAGFIATLVILMKQLDITDNKAAKKKKRKSSLLISPESRRPAGTSRETAWVAWPLISPDPVAFVGRDC